MLKIIISTTFFITLICFFCHGQPKATVYYKYKHKHIGYSLERKLQVDGNISQYMCHQEFVKEQIGNYGYQQNHNFYDIYFDTRTDSLFIQNTLKDNTTLLTKLKYPLEWEITEETASIDGYNVQKAICKKEDHLENSHVNDNWNHGKAIAWFTTEIPIPHGPMGFHGLPGLIILLEYSRSHNTFEFDKIEYSGEDIKIPSEGIKVTRHEAIAPNLIKKKWLKEQKRLQGSN